MKINSIRISNILSFEHKDNIDNCEEIKFNDGLNILIGPNGSGKSNFLEIINILFKNSFLRNSTFTDDHIKEYHKTGAAISLNRTLELSRGSFSLLKNNKSTTNIKKIKIELGLTDSDKKNITFIQDHRNELKEILQKYSRNLIDFPEVDNSELQTIESITLDFIDEGNTQVLANSTEFENEAERFVSLYLQNFNHLQNLILVANREESKDWPPLKDTFAIMSSYRNYDQISPSFKIEPKENAALSELKGKLIEQKLLHSEEKEPIVFSFLKHKIGYSFHKLVSKIGISEDHDPIEDFTDENFCKINKILEKNLDLNLHVKRLDINTLDYEFNFVDTKTGQNVKILELSAGEKGIIYFILSIFGFDLKNGVMIIDEPEIHIHPQLQELCLELLESTSNDLKLQFIIATHSPVFVNSRTMAGLQRFYLKDRYTKTVISKRRNEEKDIIRFLDFTRATRILFTDKVILVEGDSDEYFFRFYFEYYLKNNSEIKKIDLMHIIGKDYYSDWKKFFDDWQIKTFFIRDKDDFGGSDTDIESKYNDGIFILKKGKLEDYIGQEHSNKLKNVVEFCKSKFESWKIVEENKSKLAELNLIFDKITRN